MSEMTPEKLAHQAGVSPQAARLALNDEKWKRWLKERAEQNDTKLRLANLRMVSGTMTASDQYSDREAINENYETYLRMAQMDQRSRYSFVVDGGRKVGREIIKMTFVEYLQDALKNLDWRINEDLPKLRRLNEQGGIGVTEAEMKESVDLCRRVKASIEMYLRLPEDQQLIYV